MSSRALSKPLRRRKKSMDGWKITDNCLTLDRTSPTSKEGSTFQSVLLISDDSGDDAIENVSSKVLTKGILKSSDEHHSFDVTESGNDISTLPLINKTSNINKRVTFKGDDLNTYPSGSGEMKRHISYSKSPHTKKFNQACKDDESSYLGSNLVDSRDVDYSGAAKAEFIDLKTTVTNSNTTGVTKYRKEGTPLRTSRHETWNLPPFFSQKNVNHDEQQNANAALDIEIVMPLFTSTPAIKTSPKEKLSVRKSVADRVKKISPKKKSPLLKIEKPIIQKTRMPNFKAIHQNALNKMENIVDMKERKAARAKILLSGGKPENSISIKKSGGKSRKALDYHQTNEGSNNIQPSNSENVRSNIPRQTASKPIWRKVERQVKMQSKVSQASNKPQKNKIEIEKQMKSVATKSKTVHNGLEQRRNVLGNVRLNRRFELLMKMRMK